MCVCVKAQNILRLGPHIKLIALSRFLYRDFLYKLLVEATNGKLIFEIFKNTNFNFKHIVGI